MLPKGPAQCISFGHLNFPLNISILIYLEVTSHIALI